MPETQYYKREDIEKLAHHEDHTVSNYWSEILDALNESGQDSIQVITSSDKYKKAESILKDWEKAGQRTNNPDILNAIRRSKTYKIPVYAQDSSPMIAGKPIIFDYKTKFIAPDNADGSSDTTYGRSWWTSGDNVISRRYAWPNDPNVDLKNDFYYIDVRGNGDIEDTAGNVWVKVNNPSQGQGNYVVIRSGNGQGKLGVGTFKTLMKPNAGKFEFYKQGGEMNYNYFKEGGRFIPKAEWGMGVDKMSDDELYELSQSDPTFKKDHSEKYQAAGNKSAYLRHYYSNVDPGYFTRAQDAYNTAQKAADTERTNSTNSASGFYNGSYTARRNRRDAVRTLLNNWRLEKDPQKKQALLQNAQGLFGREIDEKTLNDYALDTRLAQKKAKQYFKSGTAANDITNTYNASIKRAKEAALAAAAQTGTATEEVTGDGTDGAAGTLSKAQQYDSDSYANFIENDNARAALKSLMVNAGDNLTEDAYKNTYNAFYTAKGLTPTKGGTNRGFGTDDNGNITYTGAGGTYMFNAADNSWKDGEGKALNLSAGTGNENNKKYNLRGWHKTGGILNNMTKKYQQGGSAPSEQDQLGLIGFIAIVAQQQKQDPIQAIEQVMQDQKAVQEYAKQYSQLDKQKRAQCMQVGQQIMQQMQGKATAAKYGAKLGYIHKLSSGCPDGYSASYYKKGGRLCKACIKKGESGDTLNTKRPVKEETSNPEGNFNKYKKYPENINKEKCGGKAKKHLQGGSLQQMTDNLKQAFAKGGIVFAENGTKTKDASKGQLKFTRTGEKRDLGWKTHKDGYSGRIEFADGEYAGQPAYMTVYEAADPQGNVYLQDTTYSQPAIDGWSVQGGRFDRGEYTPGVPYVDGTVYEGGELPEVVVEAPAETLGQKALRYAKNISKYIVPTPIVSLGHQVLGN